MRVSPPPPVRLALWQVALLLIGLVVWATWPLAWHLNSAVTDLGDPLLNAWALAWNAHAFVTNPLAFANANIFHPETNTLAYSELLLLPSVVLAPLSWTGLDPIGVHNLLLVLGCAGSGLTTFVLVRRLTGHDGAALVSAAMFAVTPYRMEQFPKVQLALTLWWPLALLLVHDLATRPRRSTVLWLASTMAAACYSSLYWGLFGGVFVSVVGGVAWLQTPGARVALAGRLAAAAVVAGLLVAPLAVPYLAASRVVGARSVDEVRAWSAEPRDYLVAHPESALYGDEQHPGSPERRMFPGYVSPMLALAAFIPPVVPAAIPYLTAGVVAADLSLGLNAPGYGWLYAHVPGLRALRVPARFAMCVALALSVLAGLGAARVLRGRTVVVQWAMVTVFVGLVGAEGSMRHQTVASPPEAFPAVYQWLAAQPAGVVCEYPVGPLEGRVGPQDPTYMYYSTRHWKPLVNGYSGFTPPSYRRLLEELDGFPDDRSVAHLRVRGVRYLLLHEPFYIHGDYHADVATLRARTDLQWAGRFRWRGGAVSDAFVVR